LTLRSAIEGVVATRYKEEGNEYDIRVVFKDESVDTPDEVGNITVVSRFGTYRLSQLADIQFTEGLSNILHTDKYKSIQVTGYTAFGVPTGDVVAGIRENLMDLELPSGYRIDWSGEAEMIAEIVKDQTRPNSKFIVLGDMNDPPNSPCLQSF